MNETHYGLSVNHIMILFTIIFVPSLLIVVINMQPLPIVTQKYCIEDGEYWTFEAVKDRVVFDNLAWCETFEGNLEKFCKYNVGIIGEIVCDTQFRSNVQQ